MSISEQIRNKKKRSKRMQANLNRSEVERVEGSRVVENGELRFLKEFSVVLCVLCSYCVAPSIVKGHFKDRKRHVGVKGKRIEEIDRWMMGLEGLAIRVGDVRYLGEESSGVEGLEVFLNECVCY